MALKDRTRRFDTHGIAGGASRELTSTPLLEPSTRFPGSRGFSGLSS